MTRVLVLWDVDHTLIDNGGVSRANYALAFELLTGAPPVVPASTGGRTDVTIMAGLLTDNGVQADRFDVGQQLEALRAAGAHNRPLLEERGRALAGAADALDALGATADVVQSVLTGNIEANAWVKLDAFGLADLVDFEVGAFGHESPVRADLVAVAQHKARIRGFHAVSDATVLIGDTERDVEAGRDGGARVIGVGTGGVSLDELTRAGAEWVLPDLTDTARLLAAVEEARARGPVVQASGA